MEELRVILMKAWRERWPPEQWAVYTRHSMGKQSDSPVVDITEFADMLLSQALVGTIPNALILSYLKHAVSTQVISIPTLIRMILLRVEDEKLYWIKQVLEILQDLLKNFNIRVAMQDGCSQLCNNIYQVVVWCLRLIDSSLVKIKEQKAPMEQQTVIDQACKLIQLLTQNDPTKALVQFPPVDDMENWKQVDQLRLAIMGRARSTQLFPDVRSTLEECIELILGVIQPGNQPTAMTNSLLQPDIATHCSAISMGLHVQATINAHHDIAKLIRQIVALKNIMNLSTTEMYCETLRGCFTGIVETTSTKLELQWAAFFLITFPQILSGLQQQTNSTNLELEEAVQWLISYGPLLDQADKVTECDCLQFLLGELMKHNLLTEQQKNQLIHLRSSQCHYRVNPTSQNQKSIALVLKAQPTVTTILKTLESPEYGKNQESVLGVMLQMIPNKSLDLIFTASAASGQIESFIAELVKFNEASRNSPGETGKGAQVRAALFDITFLMLCEITHKYGIQVFPIKPAVQQSFIMQWLKKFFPADKLLISCVSESPAESHKIDGLIQQLIQAKELKLSLTKWNEVCYNIPYAVKEMLLAWEAEVWTYDNIKAVMNGIKSQMCCLTLVLSVWLSSYAATVCDSLQLKCLHVIQLLHEPVESNSQYFTERSNLVSIILGKLKRGVDDLFGNEHTIQTSTTQSSRKSTTLTANEQLKKILSECQKLGWVSSESIINFNDLLKITGVPWMTAILTQELQKSTRIDALNRNLHIIHALFMVDIEPFTIELLSKVIPKYISELSVEDRVISPARHLLVSLAIMCITCMHATSSTRGFAEVLNPGDPLYKPLLQLFQVFSHVTSGCYSNRQSLDFVHMFLEEMLLSDVPVSKYCQILIANDTTKAMLKNLPQELTLTLFRRQHYLFKALGTEMASEILCLCFTR